MFLIMPRHQRVTKVVGIKRSCCVFVCMSTPCPQLKTVFFILPRYSVRSIAMSMTVCPLAYLKEDQLSLIPGLHDTDGCQTGCTTALTTGCVV